MTGRLSESVCDGMAACSLSPHVRANPLHLLLLPILPCPTPRQKSWRLLPRQRIRCRQPPRRLCRRLLSNAVKRPRQLWQKRPLLHRPRGRTTARTMREAIVHRQSPAIATMATWKQNGCSAWFFMTMQIRALLLPHLFTSRVLICRHPLPRCPPLTRLPPTFPPLDTATGRGHPRSVSIAWSRPALSPCLLGGNDPQ